jgi:FixJ family two-component response regulator
MALDGLPVAISPVVFLLDDEPAVVRALERVLHASGFVVQAWTSAGEFLAAHDALIPGCLVTDIRMPGMSGLELQRELVGCGADRSIVFITGQGDIPTAVQAIKLGAVTLLTKPVQRLQLLAAVREAISLDVARCARYRERKEVLGRLATLTPREHQVLELVASGRLNKQIAAELGTAEKTVKIHRRRVMDKMQVRSSVGLVRLLSQAELAYTPLADNVVRCFASVPAA